MTQHFAFPVSAGFVYPETFAVHRAAWPSGSSTRPNQRTAQRELVHNQETVEPRAEFTEAEAQGMSTEFDHFLEAQLPVFDQVTRELAAGEKRSHWMWFIFPQLIGLGHSHMAQRYAIHSLEAARRYAAHPVLGERLRRCTRLVGEVENRDISDIFGYPDDLKFHSSMTLFALAVPDEPLFALALDKYFAGRKDVKTLEILRLKV